MSALPPTATKSLPRNETSRRAITGREQMRQIEPLFDHLIGAADKRQRHVEAERLGGFEVDGEIKLGRLHDA